MNGFHSFKTLHAEEHGESAEAREDRQQQRLFPFANLRATSARLRVQNVVKLVLD